MARKASITDQQPSQYGGKGMMENGKFYKISMNPDASKSDEITTLEPVAEEETPKLFKKPNRLKRCRNKLSTGLHTHVALIVLVVLVTLDASCVIGQILCDILIIQDKLWESEHASEELADILQDYFPEKLNNTKKHYTLGQILEILKESTNYTASTDPHGGHSHPEAAPTPTVAGNKVLQGTTASPTNPSATNPTPAQPNPARIRRAFEDTLEELLASSKDTHAHRRVRRAAEGGHGEHSLLEELTHIFHLGSLAILSFLVFVTVLKIFAMGKKFLHHKLEMFDSFVVTVSWALDLAFLQGIWAKPGPDAATILLFLLPWRVVRIVNSFVMVIEEREHVKLKLLKLKLRTGDKKITGLKLTIERYRMEGRNLQGLCRKHGASEAEINACAPQWKRRRSSLVSLMENCAKLAFVGAIGSQPSDIHKKDEASDNSDEEDNVNTHTPRRITSTDSGVSSVSINSAHDFSNGKDNPVFMLDNGSSGGISRRGSTTSFGRRSSLASFGRRDSAASWTDYSYP